MSDFIVVGSPIWEECMTHRVADELVHRPAQAGVQRIYGIVGDSLNPITDAVRRNGKLEWIHVRHEETAAFAAGAGAQLTGKLTACAGSCGRGRASAVQMGAWQLRSGFASILSSQVMRRGPGDDRGMHARWDTPHRCAYGDDYGIEDLAM